MLGEPMPDISFDSFNTRSFEQFSQALAAGILGRGILIFGDGPDGGREAAFEGQVPYPNSATQWNGRIVIQAKFKQRPTRDARDADWLVTQLSGEADRLRELGAPDYYIVVSNIRLSGVVGKERKGGQQKLADAYRKYFKPIGVKELEVWHEEKIATLLDHQPELLRSYGAWLAPREILNASFEAVSDQVPDFGSTILRLLQRDIRNQRATRLQQAGHVDDTPTPLEDVFVDLPFNPPESMNLIDFSLREATSEIQQPGLLASLCSFISLKLDPETLAHTWNGDGRPSPARHLILGGPGQGKSTITQFLAQIVRARLLLDQPPHLLTPEAQIVAASIKHSLEKLELPLELPRRYPLRVDLPTFADAIAEAKQRGRDLSLLEFIAERTATAATAPQMTVAIMRRWLKLYPWLLILDGLDEVPPSGNRSDLLRAIEGFWDEAIPANADVAVIITSRPQGYNKDLDPRLYTHLEMLRLQPKQAISYARRLAILRLPDEERRARVLERLQAAAQNSTTALLMISPLQVAILLQLVDQRGIAPTDRWTLFNEYLSVVMKREQEKPGISGRVVRNRQLVIEGLLRRAGLLLHLEAERQGGAEAFLTIERLKEIGRDLLIEDGHNGGQLDAWADELADAATNRLVFLEQRTEGRVEFDVRSLQEFMAAAELMEGDDSLVRERIQAIAGVNHWQHVFRIAASKAFSVRDAKKYIDTIIIACQSLDIEISSRTAQLGSSIAVDLLLDGIALDQPKYRKILFLKAVCLLELNDETNDLRLAEVFGSFDSSDIEVSLGGYLSSNLKEQRNAAWRLLIRLVNAGNRWADTFAASKWPEDISARLEIGTLSALPPPHTTLAKLIVSSFQASSLDNVKTAFELVHQTVRDAVVSSIKQQMPLMSIFNAGYKFSQHFDAGLLRGEKSLVELFVSPIEGSELAINFPEESTWIELKAVVDFATSPSILSLSNFVRSLENPSIVENLQGMLIPWLLATVVIMVRSGRDANELADSIMQGSLGDHAGWIAAEKRWQKQGITIDDLVFWQDGRFFGDNVETIGAPYTSRYSLSYGGDRSASWMDELLEQILRSNAGAPRDQMLNVFSFATTRYSSDRRINSEEFRYILSCANNMRIHATLLNLCSEEVLDNLSEIVEIPTLVREHKVQLPNESPKVTVDQLAEAVLRSQSAEVLIFGGICFNRNFKKLRHYAISLQKELENGRFSGTTIATVLLYIIGRSTIDEVNSVCENDSAIYECHILFSICESEDIPDSMSEEISVAFARSTGRSFFDFRSEAKSVLKRLFDKRTSKLGQKDCWERLGLPDSLFLRLRTSGATPSPA